MGTKDRDQVWKVLQSCCTIYHESHTHQTKDQKTAVTLPISLQLQHMNIMARYQPQISDSELETLRRRLRDTSEGMSDEIIDTWWEEYPQTPRPNRRGNTQAGRLFRSAETDLRKHLGLTRMDLRHRLFDFRRRGTGIVQCL